MAASNGKAEAVARRQRFVDAYIANGGDATAAAIKAGYSAKSAAQQSSRMLHHPDVEKALAARRKELAKKFALDAESILQELAGLAYFDPADLFDDDGKLLPIKEMPKHARKAIASIEVDELFEGVGKDRSQIGWTKKIRVWDKNSAIEKAMKHLGQFAKDNAQTRPTVRLIDLTGMPQAGT